ncbi:MAG: histone deacetylase [Candidatus Jordarchaeaceae archaeon]
MAKTGIIYHPDYLEHETGNHPENKKRLIVTMDFLKEKGVLDRPEIKTLTPEKASINTVSLNHSTDYIEYVKSICEQGGGMLDPDTIVSPRTFEVALRAVGGALLAAEKIRDGEIKNSFALIRPPGHHATYNHGHGFCIFNNIAILAKHMIKNWGAKRILIVDFDAHHGNGTQDSFYDSPKVLYFSLQQWGIYPGSGWYQEIGEKEGEGYTVNIPLPWGTDDETYLFALQELLYPIADQYNPEFVLVSAGFDTHYSDTLTSMNISSIGHGKIMETILDIAKQKCNGKLTALLEGGYSLPALPRSIFNVISQMANLNETLEDEQPKSESRTKEEVKRIVQEIKKTLKPYWAF